jgi:hypothetical protein
MNSTETRWVLVSRAKHNGTDFRWEGVPSIECHTQLEGWIVNPSSVTSFVGESLDGLYCLLMHEEGQRLKMFLMKINGRNFHGKVN